MEKNNVLACSPSPHVKASRTTRRIMIDVCIALAPACVMGCFLFGLSALLMITLSLLSAVAFEFLYLLITGKKFKQILSQFDFTSCVTGLLVALSIGVNYPIYSVVIGNAFAIIVVKMLFGGTGNNLVNPAVTGRIFILISFQSVVGSWVLPMIPSIFGTSVTTSSTILKGILDGALPQLSNWDLLLGTGIMGCIGETCKLALIVGGIYLAIRKVINITYPVIYVAITGLFTVALNNFNFDFFLPSILSGGLILGAIFMATDYTTTPNTTLGNIIYFIMLGLLTAGLRMATKEEVVSFAILIMNLLVPLFDKWIRPRPFGYKKTKQVKESK